MASYLRRHWYVCNHVDYVSSFTTSIECCCLVAVSLVFFHLAALGLLSIGLADGLNCRYGVCLHVGSVVHLMYVCSLCWAVPLTASILCISN